jgi:tripartite ATP-independent transporter DctM subunit
MSFSTWIPIIVTALAFALNVPIAYGMIAAGAFYLSYTHADLGIVAGQMMGVMYSGYVLMAIPLFIFTANIMNSGKVTDAMFEFAKAAVGRRRGALGYVNVIVSLIFSGMTGSAIADAAGIGIMEIRAMKRDGYDTPFSCAITAASAIIGPIFPPSIPFVIYAMLSGTSVGALFLGGVVPALMIAATLMSYVAYISRKRNYPTGRGFTRGEFMKFTLRAFPALMTPIILLAGIYTGVMTPTEAGGIAALYALAISVAAYRVMGWREFLQTLKDTVVTSGSITILTASASVFTYIAARENLPDKVSSLLLNITDNRIALLLLINCFFLILGMFLDTAVLQYVFLPMVIPIARQLGIDMVHFGVLICLNMMIGLCTPPFGFLLFVVSNIGRAPLNEVVRETMPMVALLCIVLLLLTFFPGFVTFVPNIMME